MRISLRNLLSQGYTKSFLISNNNNIVDHRGNNTNVPFQREKNTICLITTM